MEINEEIIWKLMDIYFKDNPQSLVKHHIESYDDFLDSDLSHIFFRYKSHFFLIIIQKTKQNKKYHRI
jgi:hypothetical protein